MNKKGLIRIIQEAARSEGIAMTEPVAKIILENMLSAISDTIEKEGRIYIKDLGTFSVTIHKAREIHLPGTGERRQIPARRIVHFRASGHLKEVLAD